MLWRAASIWENSGDDLDAGVRAMKGAANLSSTFGEEVQAAVDAWFKQWTSELKARAGDAHGHATALSKIRTSYIRMDEQAAEDLRSVLTFNDFKKAITVDEASRPSKID